MIKILYTIPNFITAGSGRVLANIAEGLDRQKFEPMVCVSRKGGVIESELESQGIQVIEHSFTVKAKPYLGLFKRAKAASARFKPYHFDLWHSWHYADDYTEPIIARLAGAKAWVYTKKNMMWGSRAWVVRSLLASQIIADNHNMPEMFFNRFGLASKVRLIPHGVDMKRFKPIAVDHHSYRRQNHLPQDAILVGLVAHMVPVKGHDDLLTAVTKCPGVHLVFAGRTNVKEYLTFLQNQIQKLGLENRVHFLGNVRDMPGFLMHMDIVVLPTKKRGEGCPVSLLEAMACSKACIATDVSGSRDIIEDGFSGLLVPPEDPDALAQAIRVLMDDPALRERLGTAARERVEAHYTIEREVAANERMYLDLIKD